jgi:hypothetical protein
LVLFTLGYHLLKLKCSDIFELGFLSNSPFILDFGYISRKFSSGPRLSSLKRRISTPPPCGLLIGIYLFYENWSTETFGKKESRKRAPCNTYLSSREAGKKC